MWNVASSSTLAFSYRQARDGTAQGCLCRSDIDLRPPFFEKPLCSRLRLLCSQHIDLLCMFAGVGEDSHEGRSHLNKSTADCKIVLLVIGACYKCSRFEH